LSAAFELRKLGFNITVLDALEDRVGGRVYTYYFDKEKTLYGEFGPMRIPVTHETVWHYLNLFKLPTRPFIQVNNNAYIYLSNVRVRNDPNGINVMKYIYPQYNLNGWERTVNWQKLLFQGIDNPLLLATPEERAEIILVKPHYSRKTLFWDETSNIKMMEMSGLSQAAINITSNFTPLLKGNLYNSYIDFVEENYPASLSYLYEIPGGMQRLPMAFFNSLMNPAPIDEYYGIDPISLGNVIWKAGSWVDEIKYNLNSKKVILNYHGYKDNFNREEAFDFAICTIPFSSLRNVMISPLFSELKMRAIREVNYCTSQRTLLLCNQRFWEKDGIVGGGSMTDLSNASIWYPSDHLKYLNFSKMGQNLFENLPYNTHGVLLGAYNFNLDAIRLTNLTEKKRLEEIKMVIEKVHGLPIGYLDNIVEDFKTVNWDEEPAFRGALCFFSTEQKRIFSYCMTLPEYDERVFFAGEHISAIHRWMQGALQSGMQAANSLAIACKRNLNKNNF
ncbi:MAG: FAD-dependent oxidoreductase, partial [Bacillota bacterium]|nr:FAD-dependent oxidoreductase [Bacillota bacterium]